MARYAIAAAVLVAATCFTTECSAQCRSGSSGRSGGGSSSGGQLLTSPGSWAYNVMMTQAYQQQLARRQYAYAMAKEAERQQKLEMRRSRAEQSRLRLAERREQIRREEAARRSSSSSSANRYVSYRGTPGW